MICRYLIVFSRDFCTGASCSSCLAANRSLGHTSCALHSHRAVSVSRGGVLRKPKPGLLLRTDQGCQFTSQDWQSFLKSHGIVCSVSLRGKSNHNAAMESLFQLLERRRIKREIYDTHGEARSDMFDYIEMYYAEAATNGRRWRIASRV
jgi:transposase InsO family protein